jgi:hypothetical protein
MYFVGNEVGSLTNQHQTRKIPHLHLQDKNKKQQGWTILLPYNSEAHGQLMDTMGKKANFFEKKLIIIDTYL